MTLAARRTRAMLGGIALACALAPALPAQDAPQATPAVEPGQPVLKERHDIPDDAGEPVKFLFENREGHPIVHLDSAAVDSVGTALSARNMERLNAVEAEYQRGTYGPKGKRETRENALAAYIFGAETAFDFFLTLALSDSVIYSMSEEDLRAAFTERFRNPGLYPIVNLLDARAGFGRFGMHFEVNDPQRREITVSGEKMKAWTEEIEAEGQRFQVVNIDMKTVSHDRVHVVYKSYAGGTVSRTETEQNGTPVAIVALEDLTGQYVRKWGFHRPRALVLWKTRTQGIEAPPEAQRFLGTAIYFPHLKLKLPSLLPDVGFQDLRRFDFPEPILTMDAVREVRGRKLEWIRIRDDLRFADWEGQGVIPRYVVERFPDQ